MFRVFFNIVQDAFDWLHSDYHLTTFRLYSDYILTTSWQHPDYILTTSWLHPGYILTTFRLHSGDILTTFWLHSGYFLTALKQHIMIFGDEGQNWKYDLARLCFMLYTPIFGNSLEVIKILASLIYLAAPLWFWKCWGWCWKFWISFGNFENFEILENYELWFPKKEANFDAGWVY